MKKFFTWLICVNGILTVLLSILILGDLWITNFIEGNIMMRIVGSYVILLLNFAIFASMYAKFGDDKSGQ